MDPFAVAGNSAAAIYPEFGATQIPEGVAVYIYIIAVGQFHTSHTAIINIVVDDLDILATVCFHAQGAASEYPGSSEKTERHPGSNQVLPYVQQSDLLP